MKTWTKKFQKMLTLILAICLVTGCMGFSNVQAATGKSGTTYYDTCIKWKKRRNNNNQWHKILYVKAQERLYVRGTL